MLNQFTQIQKVKDHMAHSPAAPVSTHGQADANPKNQNGIVAAEEEAEETNLALNAACAAEKLTIRAEATAKAVIAAEAIVAMALSSLSLVVNNSKNNTADETLIVAQRAAAKVLQVAKDEAEDTLALARQVAEALLKEADTKRASSAPSTTQAHPNDA
jgi:hypothetical protein